MNPALAAWSTFFTAEVGATAALSGLVIVAISINLARILQFPTLPGRAAETLLVLVCALLIASVTLIPQPASALAVEIVTVALAAFIWPITIQFRAWSARGEDMKSRLSSRVAVTLAATLPMLIGAVLLLLRSDAGLYWLAGGVLAALAAAMLNTWVLLVEILR